MPVIFLGTGVEKWMIFTSLLIKLRPVGCPEGHLGG